MERASSKHGRRLDEQLGREVRTYLQGPPTGGRTAAYWREPEPPGGDDEPDVSPIPRPDPLSIGENPSRLPSEVRERRSRLGIFLPRSVFPARRDALLAAARAADAPEDVQDELSRLPAEEEFATVAQVWARLGYTLDERF